MKQHEMRFIVVAPGTGNTGGPEALHQLAEALDSLPECQARMLYTGERAEHHIARYTALYGTNECKSETDLRGSVIVIPEVEDPRKWTRHQPERVVCWWLSANRTLPMSAYGGTSSIFQSRHAQRVQGAWGFSGPIVSDYLRPVSSRAWTPRRLPYVVASGLRSAFPALELLADSIEVRLLIGMTSDEVDRELHSATVYVDFGWHPGRDRGAREAARAGCIVITNQRGSAELEDDVPIPSRFRLGDRDKVRLPDLVRECILNPDSALREQEDYRRWVDNSEA